MLWVIGTFSSGTPQKSIQARTERFTYEYDATGNLARVNNKQNSTSVRYVYDLSDRLVQVIQSNGNITSFTYDLANNASVVNEVINSATFKTTYTYDSDKKLTNVKDSLDFNTAYGYDSFGRLTSKVFKDASLASKFTTSYTYTGYTKDGVNYTSAQLSTITNGSSSISYLYDANGNITSISEGGVTIQYYYDSLGQVIRENNQRDSKTFTWEYDFGGNISSKKTYNYTTGSLDSLTPTTTDTYAYTNTNWKDQLTSFNGNTITYDAIGNPLTYNGRTFTWDKSRQLSSIAATGLSVSYTYNDSGIRTSKTVNGVTTNYHLNGDKVSYEKTNSVYSYYTYDSNGQLVSINYNGTEYYYIRNGQNDIIGLVNNAGTVVVNYTYSSWGEVLSTTGTLATTLGAANPYRYRGYRFDSETGYYYLQSRYYDPEMGRFINTDDQLKVGKDLTGMNLYAYSGNNPTTRIDQSGHCWIVVGALLGAITGAVAGAVISYAVTGKVNGWAVLGGAITGAAIGSGLGFLAEGALASSAATAGSVGATASASDIAILNTAQQTETIVSNMSPNDIGKTGETMAGIVKNTQTVLMNSGNRIPDMLDNANHIMGEVKNVASLSYTAQLRDYFSYATENAYEMHLWVRNSTYLSGPLLKGIAENEVIIHFLQH